MIPFSPSSPIISNSIFTARWKSGLWHKAMWTHVGLHPPFKSNHREEARGFPRKLLFHMAASTGNIKKNCTIFTLLHHFPPISSSLCSSLSMFFYSAFDLCTLPFFSGTCPHIKRSKFIPIFFFFPGSLLFKKNWVGENSSKLVY
jgi:hypothetical protein